jgi:hypothetical protein
MQPRRLAPALALALVLLLALPVAARAFCGFYVARADTSLFNRASQVVLVRDGERTVLTMASDYQGDPEEFALVVPVPTFIREEQIHVADMAIVEHLDAYTAPRLVEYHDPDPCQVMYERDAMSMAAPSPAPLAGRSRGARALGVTIEAEYTVGEYDILILSAEDSGGLVRWLAGNGYRLPEGAEPVIGSYLEQKMRFFVARVNLGERERLGYARLRPLTVAYETKKFMLPIRLGTVNADGPQELFVYALTRRGRIETTNYRTVKLPSDAEVPVFVKDEFPRFYRDLFAEQVRREDMRVVFLEYAWDMGWCDPCAADPLTRRELGELGVWWLGDGRGDGSPAQDVFVTRLHLRYTADRFPSDLVFHETGDRTNYQGRYVLRHAYQGEATCRAADDYRRGLTERHEREARTLADLTGWELAEIRRRMRLGRPVPEEEASWWEKLWGR